MYDYVLFHQSSIIDSNQNMYPQVHRFIPTIYRQINFDIS